MDFSQAEEQFRELQARVQRGEPLTEEQYQEEMQRLMVQDDHGTFWSLEPGTGRWLFFNGTEWVAGTPPRSAPPSPPAGTVPIETAAATPEGMELPASAPVQVPAIEAESVPTYERAGEGGDRSGGIAPRPVTKVPFPIDQGNNTWLPFAIGAVVLLLCAVVLFFGVRNMPFFGSASAKATATATLAVAAEPTESDIQPTDTSEPSPTMVAPTATPNVVSVTMKEKLRVRSGPSTTGNVLASLDPGTAVTAVGRNADSSWIQIQLPGKTDTGWVINNPDYLTVSGDLNSLPVVQSGAATPKATAPKATPTKTTAPKKSATPKPTPTETPAG